MLKDKAIAKNNDSLVESNEEKETLVFPVHYFQNLKEFKSVVHELGEEINELIGDTRVLFAIKKRSSIGNMVVRNKQLSMKLNNTNGQKCNAPGCLQCPLVNKDSRFLVNGKSVVAPKHLNCKSKNVIYTWICQLCYENYFGRTTQECHNRTSGHRSCFNNEDKWEKSALSLHAKDVHQNNFSLDIFSVSGQQGITPTTEEGRISIC